MPIFPFVVLRADKILKSRVSVVNFFLLQEQHILENSFICHKNYFNRFHISEGYKVYFKFKVRFNFNCIPEGLFRNS